MNLEVFLWGRVDAAAAAELRAAHAEEAAALAEEKAALLTRKVPP